MANAKLDEMLKLKDQLRKGGGDKAIEKQHAKGKMTARERLALLFDEGSFVETDLFVKHRCTNFGMEKKETPGEGVVTGYGTVNGRLIYAAAQDFTVMGGALGEMHAAKIVKAMESALKVGCPMVCINDSGGARIQEGVDALRGYGDIFYNNVLASGVIPQISVIMGPCAGGAVYSPALTDFILMSKGAQMYITGPKVITAVTGEEVDGETLGGATTHNTVTGVAQYMADNEEECIEQVKQLLSFLPQNNMETTPEVITEDDLNRVDAALNEIIPDNPNKAYNVKDIIYSLADSEEFMEYQPFFAQNIVCGFMRLGGKSVGVIANQPAAKAGCLDIDASDKSSHFIRTCDAFNIPLLTLVDVPGFLPGTEQEYGGIIRHGAKMLYAYAEATVPKITVILRKDYGGAYLAMCGRPMGADMVLAWPTAQVAVMGAEGAANVIFAGEIKAAADPEAKRAEKLKEYNDAFMTPYVAAGRGYLDDVIEPAETRKRLISAFDALQGKRVNKFSKKHGNIPL